MRTMRTKKLKLFEKIDDCNNRNDRKEFANNGIVMYVVDVIVKNADLSKRNVFLILLKIRHGKATSRLLEFVLSSGHTKFV